MKENKDAPVDFPPLPLWNEGPGGIFDTLGSYTGNPAERNEVPIQDADDL